MKVLHRKSCLSFFYRPFWGGGSGVVRMLYSFVVTGSRAFSRCLWFCNYFFASVIWAASWQNQQNGIRAQRRLKSAWASAQSDQSFRCPLEENMGSYYPLSAQRRLWSDWADTQADMSLRWAHTPLCWFCHDAAHFCLALWAPHNEQRELVSVLAVCVCVSIL